MHPIQHHRNMPPIEICLTSDRWEHYAVRSKVQMQAGGWGVLTAFNTALNSIKRCLMLFQMDTRSSTHLHVGLIFTRTHKFDRWSVLSGVSPPWARLDTQVQLSLSFTFKTKKHPYARWLLRRRHTETALQRSPWQETTCPRSRDDRSPMASPFPPAAPWTKRKRNRKKIK